MISSRFIEALNAYEDDKNAFRNDPTRPRSLAPYRSFQTIQIELPDFLSDVSKISRRQYTIEGSVGAGNYSDVPWICVFDNDITRSAQDGFYIVFLFQANMRGVYLSLNQGWTQYEREYGKPQGRVAIQENANRARNLLRSIGEYNTDPIELFSNSTLGRGYAAGNICSKYYPIDNFPSSDEIIDDLRNFIGLYRELKGLVGANIIEIRENLSEADFQEEIQRGNRINLPPGRVEKKARIINSASTSWKRDKNMSFMALENARFMCEHNNSHSTFISEVTGFQFVEAHHLIPMEFQGDFEVNIDVPENIVSLCPNCHREFHYSSPDNKAELIRKFLTLRKRLLREREVLIEEDALLRFYSANLQNT